MGQPYLDPVHTGLDLLQLHADLTVPNVAAIGAGSQTPFWLSSLSLCVLYTGTDSDPGDLHHCYTPATSTRKVALSPAQGMEGHLVLAQTLMAPSCSPSEVFFRVGEEIGR